MADRWADRDPVNSPSGRARRAIDEEIAKRFSATGISNAAVAAWFALAAIFGILAVLVARSR